MRPSPTIPMCLEFMGCSLPVLVVLETVFEEFAQPFAFLALSFFGAHPFLVLQVTFTVLSIVRAT